MQAQPSIIGYDHHTMIAFVRQSNLANLKLWAELVRPRSLASLRSKASGCRCYGQKEAIKEGFDHPSDGYQSFDADSRANRSRVRLDDESSNDWYCRISA